MAFVQYKRLNHTNCHISDTSFIKSICKRTKDAKIDVPSYEPIIEARLHVSDDKKAIKLVKESGCKWEWWCGVWGSHVRVYIKDDKLFFRSNTRVVEFKNDWLFNAIMKRVYS